MPIKEVILTKKEEIKTEKDLGDLHEDEVVEVESCDIGFNEIRD